LCYNQHVAKDAVLNVRLARALKETVQQAAAEDDRSASAMVVRIIKEWLAAHGRLPTGPQETRRASRARRAKLARRRRALSDPDGR